MKKTENGDAVVNTDGTDDTTTDSTADTTPEAAFDTTGTDSALPQTGLDTWAAALLGLFFIGLLVAARRLRSG